jgi:PAS domain S-box-containing protein
MPREKIDKSRQSATEQWEWLERADHALWRDSVVILVALAIGLAAVSRETLAGSQPRSQLLTLALLVIVAGFGAYAWRKRREITELREVLRGFQEASGESPSDEQVSKLLEIISRSQRGYRDLVDSLDHAVFTLSPQGVFQVVNRFTSQVLGASYQEIIGQPLAKFFIEPTAAEAANAMEQLHDQGIWSGRVPARLKKLNERRYFDCRFQVVRVDGSVAAISGWARDVTAQHESEIRFADLFESLTEGIFFTTPEGHILDANPALVRMLGFETKDELLQHNFRDFYADPSVRQEIVRELGERESLQGRELALRRKDGKRVYCIGSGFAIRDTFGRVVRLQGTFFDVTEQRAIERRLHEEQEFVRRLIASFPDMIAVLDREGKFTYVSPRVCEVMGNAPEYYIGRSLGLNMSDEDRVRALEKFQSLILAQAPNTQIEFQSKHADGSWRTLRANAGPLFDADGNITGIVASARDVTETKQIEQQLLQKEKLASMGQMMAGVAHELNNPLTAILGVSDLLRERATDDATRRHVEIVLQQARRAAGIIQNLLAFSRPTAQGRTRVKLGEIVQRALQLQQGSLAQKNISVEFVPAENLPEIEGDAKLLAQVFSNLITNAEQAIAVARDRGRLRVSITHVGEKIGVTFTDDGPGIPAENIGRIFDPFFTTKRPGGGTGLGLTICLAVAKEHSGSIEVQSAPGAGATFRVIFPVAGASVRGAVAPADQKPAEPSAPPTPAGSVTGRSPAEGSLRGHSVLVVDDEESIREIVQEGLSLRGMKVEGAADSEEALAHLAGATYDVVLCDFNLPGVKGEQLFEQLKERCGAALPRFVFMTGDLLDPAILANFSRKGAYVLQKPFHVAALATLLTELLQSQAVKV